MARPKLHPTDEERRSVKSFSALGTSQEHIARRLGIRSLKTLRKYYRKELDDGMLEANVSVCKTLYTMATSGRCPIATMFWLNNRAGWKPNFANELQMAPPPPFIVAKDDVGKKP
jgi:hypothetical protein